MARIRDAGRALCFVKNSASSRVKISLVTAAMEYFSRRAWQSASIRAVFPDPTGLQQLSHLNITSMKEKKPLEQKVASRMSKAYICFSVAIQLDTASLV